MDLWEASLHENLGSHVSVPTALSNSHDIVFFLPFYFF